MFWIGAAPTLPGISARFSRPGRPSLQQPLDSGVPVLAGTDAHAMLAALRLEHFDARDLDLDHQAVEVAA